MVFTSTVFCRELALPCLGLVSKGQGSRALTPTLACLEKVIIWAGEGILPQGASCVKVITQEFKEHPGAW